MPSVTPHPRPQRRGALSLLVAFAVVVTVLAGASTPAGGQESAAPGRLQVPFSTLSAALAGILRPGASPPGANDPDCRLSALRPRPVVLVHGLTSNMGVNWDSVAPLLANEGFCVFALTYGVTPGAAFPLDQVGGLTSIESSALELASFVDDVRTATGAADVDLVAQSEGTVVVQQYLKFLEGAEVVNSFVALTPLYRGTDVAGLAQIRALGTDLLPLLLPPVESAVAALCAACPQFLNGSAFLDRLNADGVAAAGVRYTNIVTRFDELVVPFTSGLIDSPGVTNHVLQDLCALDLADHVAVAFDPVAADLVLAALDPTPMAPPGCRLVLPGVGSPLAARL